MTFLRIHIASMTGAAMTANLTSRWHRKGLRRTLIMILIIHPVSVNGVVLPDSRFEDTRTPRSNSSGKTAPKDRVEQDVDLADHSALGALWDSMTLTHAL